MIRVLVCMVFGILGANRVPGQGTVPFSEIFRHYTTENGLPQSTAYALLQDGEDFLWVGTEEGLARFDGYGFKVFRHDPQDSASLGTNWIRDLAEDHNGNIWVGTIKGLFVFERELGNFRDYTSRLCPDCTGQLTVSDLLFEPERRTLFMVLRSNQHYRIQAWNLAEGTTRTLNLDSLGANTTWTIKSLCFHRGHLLAATGRRILITNAALECPRFVGTGQHTASPSINSLSPGSGNFVWGSSYGQGLWKLNLQNGRLFPYRSGSKLLDGARVKEMVRDHTAKDLYWIGTDGEGLIRLDLRQKQPRIYAYQHESSRPGSLANNRVISLVQDRSGQLWAGTENSLDVLNPDHEHFKCLDTRSLPLLQSQVILSVATDSRNTLWLGTDHGLYQLVAKHPDQPWSGFVSLEENLAAARLIPSTAGRYVRSVYVDPKDRVWAATNEPRLYKLAPNGRLLTRMAIPSFPGSQPLYLTINRMQPLDDSSFVLAHELCISRFFPRTETFENLRPGLNASMDTAFARNQLHTLDVLPGPVGKVSWASFEGVLLWDSRKGTWKKLLEDASAGAPLPRKATCLLTDPGDPALLWVGTFGEGLFSVNLEKQTIRHYTERDGLSNNTIFGLLHDSLGRIWMSTNHGISCLDPASEHFSHFGTTEGLATTEFNKIAFHKSRLGEMFFGTDQGLIMFQPGRLPVPALTPHLILTQALVNYEPLRPAPEGILQREIRFANSLELGPAQKVLSLDFAAIDLRAPARRQYAYRLEGFDPAWIYTSAAQRRATYSNLPAGSYTFQVKVSDLDGTFSKKPLALKLKVRPPFWKTAWFLGLTALLVLGGVSAAVRYYSQLKLRRQIRDMETAHKLQLERERIARDLHDHIGSKLAYLIYNLDQVADDLKEEHPEVLDADRSQQLENLNGQARDTIAQLRQTIWAMNKKAVSLEDFESRLRRFCWEHLGHSAAPNFTVDIDAEPTQTLTPLQALSLFRIAQESLSNVLKHSQATKVDLRLAQDADGLSLSIEDNGQGFDPEEAREGEHYGLKNLGVRVSEMQGSLNIQSRPGAGTRITVRIPKALLPQKTS